MEKLIVADRLETEVDCTIGGSGTSAGATPGMTLICGEGLELPIAFLATTETK
jgi:hypothetical protein